MKSLLSRARKRLRGLVEQADEEARMAMDVFSERRDDLALYHLHNGDGARSVLERSDIPGAHAVWAEVLHEGPVRAGLPRAEWRAERMRFYASIGLFSPEVGAARAKDEEALARCADAGEAVLWFEHDLYDQLCLIHHLAYFSDASRRPAELSLVCAGAFPGVPRFLGLGQLTPDQMASLFDTRQPVSAAQLDLGRRAWEAFVSPDPLRLQGLLDEADLSPLPFLEAALRRFFEEFPWTTDGLSRTERAALRGLDAGCERGADLFRFGQEQEESPFLGDAFFWWILDGLAAGARPLVRCLAADADVPHPKRRYALSDDGRALLGGDGDAVAWNGLDRWRGGVHLVAPGPHWRFDPDGRALCVVTA